MGIHIKHNYLKLVTLAKITLGLLLSVSICLFAWNGYKTHQKKNIVLFASTDFDHSKQENKRSQEYESIAQNNQIGSPTNFLRFNTSTDGAVLTDIKLIGTMNVSAENSYAVFMGKDGKQEMFKTGAHIFGVGKLRTVKKDSVLIENNSKLIKIPMTVISSSGDTELPVVAKEASDPIQSPGGGEQIKDQDAFHFVLNNPGQLMRDVWRTPHVIDNKYGGYMLSEVWERSIFDSLGMKRGDILLRINDFDISNPENILQAFTALRGRDRAQLCIIRDGIRMTMNYQIRLM